MNGVAAQSYLRTRLALMVAGMKDGEAMARLLTLPPGELLRQLELGEHEELDRELLLSRFEQAQMQRWLGELSALLRPLQGAARDVLVQWARRYELFNLKAIIRGKIAGRSNAEIETTLFDLPSFLSLDHEELLNTDSVAELLRRLSHTPYGRLAEQALRRFEEKSNPFLLDATLDQQFYSDLMARVHKLEEPDRNAMIQLTGRIIDRHNLVWLMRYRFNYELTPAETRYLLIDRGLRLDSEHLRRLVNLDTPADLVAALPGPLAQAVAGATTIMEVEDRLQLDLSAYMNRVLRGSPSVLASAIAYLVLRFYELRNIRMIAHARLHGLDDDLLRSALYPMREAAA